MFRQVAVRLENNACQISWQSDENCVSNWRKACNAKVTNLKWHYPPDTRFEIRSLVFWGRARCLSVTEAPTISHQGVFIAGRHKPTVNNDSNNTEPLLVDGDIVFQDREKKTGSRGVTSGSANHYVRWRPTTVTISQHSNIFVFKLWRSKGFFNLKSS